MNNMPVKTNTSTIVVVNDNESRRNSLCGLLRRENLDVRMLESAEAALLCMDSTRVPDIIVTDIHMPDIDGRRFCRLLRSPEYAAFNKVPILVFSSSAFTGENISGITADLGADAILSYPIDDRLFIEQVQAILRGEQKHNPQRVLIVEHDKTMDKPLTDAFTAAGYQVDIALTARDAADAFVRTNYNVAVIDYSLPDGKGDRLLTYFRKAGPDCICIMMTTDSEAQTALSWIRQGATIYLRKPFDPSYLVNLCVLERREQSLLRREDALRKSEFNFRTIIESFEDIYYQTDLNGVITLISPSVYRIFGWKPEELIGQPVAMIHETLEERLALLKTIKKHGYVRDYELELTKPDGSIAIVSLAAHIIYDFNGSPTGIAGSLRDVTDRKLAEEELQKMARQLSDVIDFLPDATFVVDNQKKVIVWNKAMEKLTGIKAENMIGKGNYEYGIPFYGERRPVLVDLIWEDNQDIVKKYAYVKRNGETLSAESFCGTIYEGRGAHYYAKASPLYDQKGNIVGAIELIHNITEYKKAQQAMLESEEKYRKIFENTIEGIFQTTPEGKYLQVNPAFARILGYESPEKLKTSIYDIGKQIYPEPSLRQEVKRLLSEHGMIKDYEVEHVRKDNKVIWVVINANVIRDEKGNILSYQGTIMDVTEKKRLESQLLHAQKMEAIGRLAGGVAHDFNNMLGVILGRAEIAMMKLDPSQQPYIDLLEIQKAAERSADLTRQLLAFARKQTVAPIVLNLNDTVEGTLKMLRRLIGEDIDLVWMPDTSISPVKMDPSQIDQILANLCVNARDAITGVGKVTIETGSRVFDEAYCANHTGFIPGEYVMLSVSDDGCGMDKETMNKLFEPFFTTKGMGKGTGLGLATVYGIVRQNNGFINVYSEPGHGTTLSIYLSRHTGKTGDMRQNDPTTPATPGNETILFAEDEPAILEMTTMMLQHLGYTVLKAGTPGEAIRIAQKHRGKIHLLVTDVVMPDMNGRELARRLRTLYPNLRCLFTSGYTANVIAHHGVLDKDVHFIQKPFSITSLAAKVREALEQ